MTAIREFMLGEEAADSVRSQLEAIGLKEIQFYEDKEVLDGFRKINSIS